MSLHEVEEAASIVQHAADAEANIIVGQVINPEIGDDLIVTVIATGFEREEQPAVRPVSAERPAARPAPNGRPAQQVLTGVHATASDRPHKDLDRPTFLRRMGETREAIERVAVVGDDEWDVPTFLRKQAD
jgi:cell division protein FtsZ